ncbi:hypothetical protein D3C84_784430 [compost metagenome]
MIGQFEVMIGHQQYSTVLLHVDTAGLGARYARRQPDIAHAPGQMAWQAHHAAAIVAKPLDRLTLRVEQCQCRKRAVLAFVLQASDQDVSIGQHLHLARHGLETRFELADDTALSAKGQVRRTVLQQTRQAKAAAARHCDLCRHQQTTL